MEIIPEKIHHREHREHREKKRREL